MPFVSWVTIATIPILLDSPAPCHTLPDAHWCLRRVKEGSKVLQLLPRVVGHSFACEHSHPNV